MQVSGKGVGWERIGDPTDDFRGDLRGDSSAGFTGELMDSAAGDIGGGDEAGAAIVAPAGDGDGSGEKSWTGAGEGHTGLLVVGDGIIFSTLGSSETSGSGKNRVPGDFTSPGGDI